jgi:uncharacterized membrane protein YfcA
MEGALPIAVSGLVAGGIGALTGLGGGVIIVPLLTIVFSVPLREAVAVSLLSVIATSCAAAPRFHKSGLIDARLGAFMQLAACLGALAGAFLTGLVSAKFLFVLFGGVLAYTAASGFAGANRTARGPAGGSPPESSASIAHVATEPRRLAAGLGIMAGAGVLSALLGIGSGAFNVLALERALRVPFRVATATSSLIIGATAATSAGVYLSRGLVSPGIAAPLCLGVIAGSTIGAGLVERLPVRALRLLFSVVLAAAAARMVLQGLAP